MEFSVLGPVAARDDGREIGLSPRLRTLLAVLLCHRGRVVSADRLVDALWGEHSPAAATRSLHVYVHRLRGALGDADRIERRPPGYLLVAAADEVDADRFADLVERGRARLAAGDAPAGTRLLRRALAEWRGDAYDGWTDIPDVRDDAERLAERRMTCARECLRAELDLGRAAEVAAEARGLVAAHPFDEGLRGLLMRALYRLGRATEALEAYREGRTLLADELGLEPGPGLRDLERAITDRDPSLDLPRPAAGVPRELPPDIAAFTGRADRVAALAGALTAAPAAGERAGPRVAAIDGAAGVGKSALAIRVAHEVAGAYPDGQLYVNLHGHTAGSEPLAPGEALDRFLRALGEAAQPPDAEEAAARFRSLTADRRVLVVLDNAVDEAQVRPLLPAGAGCGVLVTGRRVLAALDGMVRAHLDALPPSDATALLARLAGADRVAADPEAAAEVARLCGNWPLALRIAGARLVVRPDLALAAFADRLAEDRGRLDELRHGDLAVRASLAASHRQNPEEARTLACLGVFNGHTITPPVAAAAIGTSARAAGRDLDRLVESQFLQPVGAERYEMHDLVRAYAREQAETLLTPKEYDAALDRVLRYYLAAARGACVTVEPSMAHRAAAGAPATETGPRFADADAVTAWYADELDNLVAACRRAATSAEHAATAAGLAVVLTLPLYMRGASAVQVEVAGLGLAAAERAGDLPAQAIAHRDLSMIHCRVHAYDAALEHASASVAVYRAVPDAAGEALGWNAVGSVHLTRGEPDAAVTALTRAIEVCRAAAPQDLVFVLSNIGHAYRLVGRLPEALAACAEGAELSRRQGLRRSWAISVGQEAAVLREMGRTDEAVTAHEKALELAEEGGFRSVAAESRWMLAELAHERGDPGAARAYWLRSADGLLAMGSIDAAEYDRIAAAEVPSRPAVFLGSI